MVQNNEWGASDGQCVTATGDGFTVDKGDHHSSGTPAAYPSIMSGCWMGTCTTGTTLPKQISQLAPISSSIAATVPAAAKTNLAYDIWADSTPKKNGGNDAMELMIWLKQNGGIAPVGTKSATASIGGATWDVWKGTNGGVNVISYVRQGYVDQAAGLPITDFVKNAVAQGAVKDTDYLTNIQAGFEPWVGGPGLKLNSFSVNYDGPSAPAAAGTLAPTAGSPTATSTPPTTTPSTTDTPSTTTAAASPSSTAPTTTAPSTVTSTATTASASSTTAGLTTTGSSSGTPASSSGTPPTTVTSGGAGSTTPASTSSPSTTPQGWPLPAAPESTATSSPSAAPAPTQATIAQPATPTTGGGDTGAGGGSSSTATPTSSTSTPSTSAPSTSSSPGTPPTATPGSDAGTNTTTTAPGATTPTSPGSTSPASTTPASTTPAPASSGSASTTRPTGATTAPPASGGSAGAQGGQRGKATGAVWSMTGGLAGWKSTPWNNQGATNPAAAPSPNVPGRQAVKFDNPPGGKRTEAEPDTPNITAGDTYVGYSAVLDQGFPVDASSWLVIMQFKQQSSAGSPPFSVEIGKGNVRLAFNGTNEKDFCPVQPGQPFSFVLHAKFPSGPIDAWCNGKQTLTKFAPPGGKIMDGGDAYLKTGVYKDTGIGHAVLFLDDLKVGRSLADVSGLAGGTDPAAGGGGAAATASPASSGSGSPRQQQAAAGASSSSATVTPIRSSAATTAAPTSSSTPSSSSTPASTPASSAATSSSPSRTAGQATTTFSAVPTSSGAAASESSSTGTTSSATAPATSSAGARHAPSGNGSSTTAAAATSGGQGAAAGVVWDRIAQCESGGNWSINTGNGFSGGLQFTPATWKTYGGTAYAPAAFQASRAQQITVAGKVQAGQGWGAWPVCSKTAGAAGAAGAAADSSAVVAPAAFGRPFGAPSVSGAAAVVVTVLAPLGWAWARARRRRSAAGVVAERRRVRGPAASRTPRCRGARAGRRRGRRWVCRRAVSVRLAEF